jgi:hypothetical protein
MRRPHRLVMQADAGWQFIGMADGAAHQPAR